MMSLYQIELEPINLHHLDFNDRTIYICKSLPLSHNLITVTHCHLIDTLSHVSIPCTNSGGEDLEYVDAYFEPFITIFI